VNRLIAGCAAAALSAVAATTTSVIVLTGPSGASAAAPAPGASAGDAPVASAPSTATPSPSAASPRSPRSAATVGAGDLDRVAAVNKISSARLQTVVADPTARLDAQDRLLYVEPTRPRAAGGTGSTPKEAAATSAAFPYDQTFHLHSDPTNPRKIFLDFDGVTVSSGSFWAALGVAVGNHPGFSLDADATTFSPLELDEVQQVWQSVSEDYAALSVDVTTEDPGPAGLLRTGPDDSAFGQRVAISTNDYVAQQTICPEGCGGYSYIGTIGQAEADPSWVFTDSLGGGDTKQVAEAAAHEAGHALGLHHDGTTDGTPYYAGAGVWAPIMGISYGAPLTQFSKGEYPLANNTEDDFAVMAATGVPLRTPSGGTLAGTTWAADGVVVPAQPSDYTWTTACAGAVQVTATTAAYAPDLDLSLTLISGSTGLPLASADPAVQGSATGITSGLGATLSATVPAGTYTVRVQGVGAGDPAAGGYSAYGSVGRFHLATTSCGSTPAPAAPTGVTATPGTAAATVRWTPPSGTLTGFTVTASPGGAMVSAPATATSTTVSGLTNGVPYTFTVTASSAAGTSAPSMPSAPVVPSVPVIYEPFTSSAAAMTKVLGGTWSLSSGRYRLTAPSTASAPNANLAVHKTSVSGDFTLWAAGGAVATSSTANDFSIVFDYRDPTHYYFANFSETNDANGNGLFKVNGATVTQLADFTTTITAGTSYPLRVERQGATLRVFRSGLLVGTATDSAYLSGKVGFGSRNDSASFDDLTVRSSSAASAATPTITARTPAPGTVGYTRTANVLVTFSEPVSGVSTSTLSLRNTVTGNVVAATVTRDGSTNRWILNPTPVLLLGTSYTVSVGAGITNSAGGQVAPTTWSFTTNS
jgi:hypothetical protein